MRGQGEAHAYNLGTVFHELQGTQANIPDLMVYVLCES